MMQAHRILTTRTLAIVINFDTKHEKNATYHFKNKNLQQQNQQNKKNL